MYASATQNDADLTQILAGPPLFVVTELASDSLLMLILLFGLYIVWIWSVTPRFPKYILPPSSRSKCVR
jgi:hypothetical protein